MSDVSHAETHAFQAEVRQVLELVIHSLYSHKEIFLRELISNASDACDKLRFAALANPALTAGDSELRVEISVDREARSLTLRDNGIGMTREELVENLGTIARSGTRRFLENLSGDQRRDTQLIGQFGVGFYSAFIVADRVSVTSRAADSEGSGGWRWSSDGKGEFALEPVEDAARGTQIVLHLKEGEDEFLQDWRLRSLIGKYSDHIAFPIRMHKAEAEGEGEWQTVNQASALWTRPKTELSDEDYQGFYRHVSHDFNDALSWSHNRVEGAQVYTTLLYVPSKAPFDLMYGGRDERKGLKLYIRRVFIMDAAEQLLPNYLRFVRGVVDSDDLPLNVSREILQDNPLLSRIRSGISKRVLDLLDRLAREEGEKYQAWWKEFGQVLKEGIVEDASNRERIAKLMRFASTRGEGEAQTVSLDDYIARMAGDQDTIWYLTADSWLAARNSPQIESLRAKGVEVLLLSDRVDEWMIGHLHEYAGKPLRHVAKSLLDDSASQGTPETGVAPRIASALAGRVRAVRPSTRLTESPCCLVLDQQDLALHMQRLLKQAGHEVPNSEPVLEINPEHPLIQRMDAMESGSEFDDLAQYLYEQSVVAEGGQLEDPASFVKRVNRLLN